MKRNVWLTVHGEQQYEGMSADSSNLRVRGTMEETRDGCLLRYEETDGDGKVTTATRLALAPDCIILTRTGEVTSEMVFAEGKEHTSFYAVPYGTLPVAVKGGVGQVEARRGRRDAGPALCNYYRRAERKMRPAHPRENRRIKEKELPAAAPFYAPMSSRTKNADARNITTSAQSAAGIV